MSEKKPIITLTDNMVKTYIKLLKFIMKEVHILEDKTVPVLHNLIDSTGKNFSKLNEMTDEESDKISDYLKRDLDDTVNYIEEAGTDFKKWITLDTIDTEIIEDYIIDQFKQAADPTTVELAKIILAAEIAESEDSQT